MALSPLFSVHYILGLFESVQCPHSNPEEEVERVLWTCFTSSERRGDLHQLTQTEGRVAVHVPPRRPTAPTKRRAVLVRWEGEGPSQPVFVPCTLLDCKLPGFHCHSHSCPCPLGCCWQPGSRHMTVRGCRVRSHESCLAAAPTREFPVLRGTRDVRLGSHMP